MTVHRLSHYASHDPYTRVPNTTVADTRIDLKAKGLLLVMLSKPDKWVFTERNLADQTGVSREQIRTALGRLQDAGYVTRQGVIGEGGRVYIETRVYDLSILDVGTEPQPRYGTATSPGTEPGPEAGTEPVPVSKTERARRNTRARDLLFEAVAEVCGHDLRRLTRAERGKTNTATKMLREVDATPDEVRAAARAWKTIYPNATLTPTALSAHWTRLAPPRKAPTCPDCGQTLEAHDQQLHDLRTEGHDRW